MTPHDELLSAYIKLIRHMDAYLEEFDPDGGGEALELLKASMVKATHFVGDDSIAITPADQSG